MQHLLHCPQRRARGLAGACEGQTGSQRCKGNAAHTRRVDDGRAMAGRCRGFDDQSEVCLGRLLRGCREVGGVVVVGGECPTSAAAHRYTGGSSSAPACPAGAPRSSQPRPTAAIPMDNPYRSCRLTRVRPLVSACAAECGRTCAPPPCSNPLDSSHRPVVAYSCTPCG